MTKSVENYLRQKHGKWYLVKRYREGEKRREKWTRLDEASLKNLLAAVNVKMQLSQEVVEVPCMNPFCSNKVLMTPQQKQDLLISFKKKYDKLVLICCSKECQKKVSDLLQQN
jgi:hypothetical protein